MGVCAKTENRTFARGVCVWGGGGGGGVGVSKKRASANKGGGGVSKNHPIYASVIIEWSRTAFIPLLRTHLWFFLVPALVLGVDHEEKVEKQVMLNMIGRRLLPFR